MSKKDIDRIEDYINGKLTEQEKKAFEQRLTQEPELSNALNDQKKMHQYLSHKISGGITLDEIRELNKKKFSSESNNSIFSIFRNRYFQGIAAAILLAITAFVVFKISVPTQNPENLYQAYKKPIPLELTTRGEEVCSNYQDLVRLFNSGVYDQTLPLIETCLQEDPSLSILKLAQGYSLMETADYTAAKKVFSEISNGSNLLKSEAEFYLALIYLKEGNLEESQRLLQSSNASDEDATKRKLLKAINKLIEKG